MKKTVGLFMVLMFFGNAAEATMVALKCTGQTCKDDVLSFLYVSSQSKGLSVAKRLQNWMDYIYQGMPDPNGKKMRPLPVCSFRRGEIQAALLAKYKVKLNGKVEDRVNFLNQSCGDLALVTVDGSLAQSNFSFSYFTGKKVSPAGIKEHGLWERTHFQSLMVPAVEESFLQIKRELEKGQFNIRSAEGRIFLENKKRTAGPWSDSRWLRQLAYEEARGRAAQLVQLSGLEDHYIDFLKGSASEVGESCAATLMEKTLRGNVRSTAELQTLINRDCVSKLKLLAYSRVASLFPLLFASK